MEEHFLRYYQLEDVSGGTGLIIRRRRSAFLTTKERTVRSTWTQGFAAHRDENQGTEKSADTGRSRKAVTGVLIVSFCIGMEMNQKRMKMRRHLVMLSSAVKKKFKLKL